MAAAVTVYAAACCAHQNDRWGKLTGEHVEPALSTLNPRCDNQGGDMDTIHLTTAVEMHFSKTLNPSLIQGGP